MTTQTPDYHTLDAIVVIIALGIFGGAVFVLEFHTVPQANLPIVASMLSALVSAVIAGYAAFRWGNNVGAKTAIESLTRESSNKTAALSQIAGATPPAAPVAVVAEVKSEQEV